MVIRKRAAGFYRRHAALEEFDGSHRKQRGGRGPGRPGIPPMPRIRTFHLEPRPFGLVPLTFHL